MRLSLSLVPPALVVVTGLLGVGCDMREEPGTVQSTAASRAAHPPVRAPAGAVTPPALTAAYPQASSGPGTPSFVPTGTQPDVIAFVHQVLDRAKAIADKGRTKEAIRDVEALEYQRPAWSRATQDALAPEIGAALKSISVTGQPANQ